MPQFADLKVPVQLTPQLTFEWQSIPAHFRDILHDARTDLLLHKIPSASRNLHNGLVQWCCSQDINVIGPGM